MQLLGVEFTDYACFDRRLIPLRSGVQILVGKNNAGKTAILRGLGALGRLPFTFEARVDASLDGYCRGGEAFPSFGLNLWFAVDSEVWPLIAVDHNQPPFYDPADARLVYKFRVFPQQNTVGLTTIVLLHGAKEVEIFKRHPQIPPLISRLDPKGITHHNEQLRVLGERASIGSMGSFPLLSPHPFFEKLLPLANVKWVDSRRFAKPNLQAKEEKVLPANAESLALFLLTQQGSNRKVFNKIQDFIIRVFPEFDSLNPELHGDLVSLTLTLKGTDTRVPLGFCGSGVEQLLALSTFLLSTPAGTTLLLDEPHVYLHPSAERAFISLLMEDHERKYVISTHSPVMMNSVPADRIINILAGETGSFHGSDPESVGPILASLGYKNSDFLLYDRLILGEGKTDAAVLPVLLRSTKKFTLAQVERTGFPITEGADSSTSTKKQTIILRYEKLLQELGMSVTPRVYLRDGDAAPDEKTTLQGTKQPGNGKPVPVKFLPRTEIENYLLVPDAIAQALRTLMQFAGSSESLPKDSEIKSLLESLLASKDPKLFPAGSGSNPLVKVKGSVVLKTIFETYNLRYEKGIAGALIAEHVTFDNQPLLEELAELVADLFKSST